MALDSVTKDLLLDHALHPVAKPPLTSTGAPHSAVLDCPPFVQRGGERLPLKVITADGTPAITRIDGDGQEQLVPLKRINAKPIQQRPEGLYTIYAQWTIPEHELVPDHLAGAVINIRHNSKVEERQSEPHTRRTRSLSTIPVTDPDFDRIFGGREDVESANAHLKSTFPNGRARTTTRGRVWLDLLGFQINTLVTALHAHHHAIGNSVRRWYGKHLPESSTPRASPLQLAA